MTLFSHIRRKRHAASKLGAIVFAWLIVTASPCAMAFLPDGQPHEATGASEIHKHSHDQSANPTLGDDCCCDHADGIKADSPKPFKSISLLTLPSAQFWVESLLLPDTQHLHRILPVDITSPPVYLSTQRLRI